MKTRQLLVRSLLYYWRTNLAVLLGVIAGTAVISGALVVGDSVRDSLRQMTLDRLGKVDHVLTSYRFIRQDVAEKLQQQPEFSQRFSAVAPALVLQGGLVVHHADSEISQRAGNVTIYGTDERLWDLTKHGDVPAPTGDALVLNRRTADQLDAQVGDELTLWIELPSSIPRDTLLGKREQTTAEVSLTVGHILDEDAGAGRLQLNPNQQLPLTAFVALDTLQSALGLSEIRPSRRNPTGAPARINTLFVSALESADQSTASALDAADSLNMLLASSIELPDLNLRVQPNEKHGYLSLESEQMILETGLATAGLEAAQQLELATSPVLVYLANELQNTQNAEAFSMYSIVAGVDFTTLKTPPFGPWEFVGTESQPAVGMGEIASGGPGQIVLNDWLAADLKVEVGETVNLRYHTVGSHGELPEEERTFEVAGIVKLQDTLANDRGLTPHVKGITDAETFGEWEQPFPMKLDRVTRRDDDYWEEYRATPKAFVSLATAQHLWQSRYGDLTSLRVSLLPGTSLDETADAYSAAVLQHVDLPAVGLAFTAVKYQGLQASSGTTDFSGLFIGFSFFLILSAMILISLLFRLGMDRRGKNIGLLSAVGCSARQIRFLFLTEGLIVVTVGGLLGSLAAVGYASLMVYGLTTWWIGAIGTKFLAVSVHVGSLLTGFLIAVGIAVGVVWWALREMRSVSARDLLAGVTEKSISQAAQQRRGRRATRIVVGSLILAGLLMLCALAGLIPASEAFSGLSWRVVAFFLSGISTLVASLAGLTVWIDSDHAPAVRGAGMAGLGRLGMRNAARHRQRSVLSTGLIASATFVIVAVAAGQRNPAVEEPDKQSGNGGFHLVAESSTPVLRNLNVPADREEMNLNPDDDPQIAELLERMQVVSFRVKPGESASCLNIYQTHVPTILGVPQAMIDRGGFKFADTPSETPWQLLNEERPDGEIPVLGDMNTLMYSLHKGIGATIGVPNDEHPQFTMRVAGMLDGSIFQGVLLMSEANFHKVFPEQVGYRYFLIGDRRDESPDSALTSAEARELSDVLETRLTEFGFDAQRVVDRLAAFLAVQNTYLSTFQTLGGLGLLLGTLGLATVMLRNVMERRAELALLRAVGFRKSGLSLLVVWENAFLLVWGLFSGTVSALLAMLPHLLSTGADVPWVTGGAILGGVFLVGMVAALLAVAEAVRTPILSTLRSE